jgi:hypothetical protein
MEGPLFTVSKALRCGMTAEDGGALFFGARGPLQGSRLLHRAKTTNPIRSSEPVLTGFFPLFSRPRSLIPCSTSASSQLQTSSPYLLSRTGNLKSQAERDMGSQPDKMDGQADIGSTLHMSSERVKYRLIISQTSVTHRRFKSTARGM